MLKNSKQAVFHATQELNDVVLFHPKLVDAFRLETKVETSHGDSSEEETLQTNKQTNRPPHDPNSSNLVM